jgi:hypothetical protein
MIAKVGCREADGMSFGFHGDVVVTRIRPAAILAKKIFFASKIVGPFRNLRFLKILVIISALINKVFSQSR